MASCEDPVRVNDGSAAAEVDLDDPFPAEGVRYCSSHNTSDNVCINLFIAERSPLDRVVTKQLIVYQSRKDAHICEQAEKEATSLHNNFLSEDVLSTRFPISPCGDFIKSTILKIL